MPLSEDEILNLLGHSESCARRLALNHFAETYSSRTDLLPKAREAWKTFGRKEAFGFLPDLSWLNPTDAALPWLVEELESLPAPQDPVEDEEDDDVDVEAAAASEEQLRYADGLLRAIFKFSPAFLRPFAERLSAAACVDEYFRERLQWNLEREHATAADAWNALLEWKEGIAAEYATFDEDEDNEFDITDFPSADAWRDVLLRNIHDAPRKSIINHLREVQEEEREFPDDLLVNYCLQAIAAGRNWQEALPLIITYSLEENQDLSSEAEDALAHFPTADVLPYVQSIVANRGAATADMALLLVHHRSPEVIATARAMLPLANSKLTTGLLCEALCMQFDREAFELAAETSRETGIGCMTYWQLLGVATALHIEHPDLAEWRRLDENADARTLEMTQLILEDMQCGPDCGHDHGEVDEEEEDWSADDGELDLLDEDNEEMDGHQCGPDCGHDHGHHHEHAPRFIEPMSPDTFKHDTIAVGRNEPCPCGSGKKFKKCCMRGAGD